MLEFFLFLVAPQQLGYSLGSDLSNTMTVAPIAQPTHHHGPQNAQIDVISLEELDRLKQTSTSGNTRMDIKTYYKDYQAIVVGHKCKMCRQWSE